MLSAIKFISIDLNENLLDWVVRLLVSCVCGFLIGFERKTRSKEAGIRTHAIVCMAAALMMIISKYAFSDTMFAENSKGTDTSRVASQIVTGIGFLGAGIIFYRKDMLRGLTTAAGIWATAGIGMALGAGMYIIGVASTAILIIMQVILHKPFKIFRARMMTSLRMTLSMEDGDVLEKIKQIFDSQKILRFKTISTDTGIVADIELLTHKTFTETEIYDIVKQNTFIKTLEKTEEM